MVLNLLRGSFSREDLIMLLLRIPIVLISLSFHEMAHGFAADKLGDNTARWNGRVTMNPLKHLDPIGSLAMVFFGIGWAKPVPINPRNFKNPKKGMAITAAAGPISNLILAFVGALCYNVTRAIAVRTVSNETGVLIAEVILLFFFMFEYMNLYLAVFNMIPIPPFDGSRIFYFVLPDKAYFGIMKYERIIMAAVMVLLYTGILSIPISFIADKISYLFHFIIGLVPFL